MTQNTEIQVSSPAEPFALTSADKQPLWAIFQKEFDMAKENNQLAELKKNFPACQQILSLFLHLHSDCANPELAAYKTLQWLAAVAQYDAVPHTYLAFSDGEGTGKTLLCKNILQPVFGNKSRFIKANDLKDKKLASKKLNFVSIRGIRPHQEMKNAHKYLSLPRKNKTMIFFTNQFILPNPENRRVRIARCSTQLHCALRDAVIAEIENGGLVQFTDLLHTIDGSTKQLPNLNAIY